MSSTSRSLSVYQLQEPVSELKLLLIVKHQKKKKRRKKKDEDEVTPSDRSVC